MSLVAVRDWFIEDTGRLDLELGSGADNGANKYINAAQRWLDRFVSTHKSVGRHHVQLAVGEWHKEFRYFRAIESVWITKSDGTRVRLVPKDFEWLRDNYKNFDDVTAGTPCYWAPNILGLGPEQEAETSSGTVSSLDGDTDDIKYYDATGEPDTAGASHGSTHFKYRGIVVMPKTDVAYPLSIFGQVESTALSADADVSFWTEVRPEVLVLASMMMLERIGYRNFQGAADIEAEVNRLAIGEENQTVYEELALGDQMDG